MSLPTLPRDYARWRALHTLVEIVVDAYEAQTDRVIAVHFGGDPDAFQTAMRNGLADMRVPTQAHMRELLDLIMCTSASDYTLGYEDRDYLTRVRSHLVDALTACMAGDIEHTAMYTDEAYKALHFLTYERKRTDKRDFHNPFDNERVRFERLTRRCSQLARTFDKVVVSA